MLTELPSVSIATPRSRADADAIVSLLAQSGIASSIRGDAPPHEILVKERDSDAADQILNQLYGVDGAEDQPLEVQPEAKRPRCPECDSAQVERVFPRAHLATFALLLYGVGLAIERTELAILLIALLGLGIFVADRWRCSDCGQRWRGGNTRR